MALDAAYNSATLACAVLLVLGGIVSWLTIPAGVVLGNDSVAETP